MNYDEKLNANMDLILYAFHKRSEEKLIEFVQKRDQIILKQASEAL